MLSLLSRKRVERKFVIQKAPTPTTFEPPKVQLPPELVARLDANLEHMKVLPAIAMQALQIAKDPDCSINAFSSVVERDVNLATDMLRMANSVVFSGGHQVTSLHQAIVRLGFRHCKNLILSSCVGSLMRRLSVEEAWVRETLWRHGFLTGLLAANTNNSMNLAFAGEEFTAGLIHDIGRTLFALCLPKDFARIDPLTFIEDESVLELENQVAGTNHCEVGAWFAQLNHLPESLTDAIQFHHQPNRSNHNQTLVSLIAVSDEVANFLQRSNNMTDLKPEDVPSLIHLEASGVENAVERFHAHAAAIIKLALADATNLTRNR